MTHLHGFPFSSAFTSTVLLAATATAQGIKLNGPLARPLGGDIRTAEFSPDGTRVVYVADQEADGVFELFVAKPNVPGLPVKLAGPSVEGGGVHPFVLQIGAKGQRIVFAGDLDTHLQSELYSVPLAGGPVVKLNPPMAPGGDVRIGTDSFQIDADESRVVWLADDDGDQAIELFSAPIAGGPTVKLNAPIAGFRQDVDSFLITSDGTRVVYLADQDEPNVAELYSVPITGGTPVRLNPAGRVVDSRYVFDASGTRVVFSAYSRAFQQDRLYSAAIDGHGGPLQLLTASVPNVGEILAVPGSALVLCTLLDGPSSSRLAAVPLDGSGERILATVDRPFLDTEVTPDGTTALYRLSDALLRVPVDGSAPATSIAEGIHSFQVSPDSQHVVYLGGMGLVSARIDGSSAPLELAPAGPLYPVSFAITPDGQRVALLQSSGPTTELFSVPILGGKAPIRLNAPLVYGGNVERLSNAHPFLLGALGHVVYLADQVEDGRNELFSVPIEGGRAPHLVNGQMPIGPVEGDVQTFEVSSDGRYAVFSADEIVQFRNELFSVRTDGRSDPVRLHEPLAEGQDARYVTLSPDGQTAVYWLSQSEGYESELRAVPVEGGAPTVLAGPFPGSSDGVLWIEPTSTRVVFEDRSTGGGRLFSVPLDASAPPVLLDIPAHFRSLTYLPDGTRLLCLGDDDGDALRNLLSVPLDGTPNLQLEGSGRVFSYTLSPDGTRVLFLADSVTPQQFEGFSVPLDGSAPPLRLTPPLPAQASVSRLAAAGDFAFYTATQDTLSKIELYRVPLDGSALSVKLNAPLVNGGNVMSFAPTPDGTRVVYHADQELDERYELYSVMGDGSGPVKKLNPPVGSGDVGGDIFWDALLVDVFALSPDGTRVAFRADPTVVGSKELLVAPVDGSAPAKRVSPAPQSSSSVLRDFRFAPDGRRIAFRTYLQPAIGQPAEFSLYLGSADGLRAPRKIAGPGGLIPEFRWLPGSDRVVYVHDAETLGVRELFTSTGHARPHDAPTRFVTRPK